MEKVLSSLDYLTLRNKKIPNKGKVYQEFKKLYPNKKDEEYIQELEKIKSLSVHYKKFVNPNSIQNSDSRKELIYISRLEINVAYPFLLQVFEDADNGLIDHENLVRILKLIQSYAWRRFITGLPTNALNKIFMTLYSEVDIDEYFESIAKALVKKKGSAKFPTNEDIKIALKDRDLYNIKAKNRNYMFEMLENYNNREHVDTSNENITIEHIFPRNPNEDWSTDLGSDDFFQLKEKYLNTIGNLTLSGNNGALSNKSFSDKKNMNTDGKQQGYKYSRLWLNKFLNEIDFWNLENYEKRFNILLERFLNIWEFPDVDISIIDDELETSIYDAERPTHKKLDYFIFEDNKIEQPVIAQMYFYILKILFERNPQLLFSLKDTIRINKTPTDFRSPQELTNGYFIEANIDSNTKFNVLKSVLLEFELEEELYIKYSPTEKENTSNRFSIRKNYWKQLLPKLINTQLFGNRNPSRDQYTVYRRSLMHNTGIHKI